MSLAPTIHFFLIFELHLGSTQALALHSRITARRLKGLYEVPGHKPGLTTSKANIMITLL